MNKIDKYYVRDLSDVDLNKEISNRLKVVCYYFPCSHDQIARALNLLERSIQMDYVDNLKRLIDHHDFMEYEIVLATPRQKAEALLMTLVNNSIDFRLGSANTIKN